MAPLEKPTGPSRGRWLRGAVYRSSMNGRGLLAQEYRLELREEYAAAGNFDTTPEREARIEAGAIEAWARACVSHDQFVTRDDEDDPEAAYLAALAARITPPWDTPAHITALEAKSGRQIRPIDPPTENR